jgi:uncharacterized repeat protein (TIGR03803 family)
LLRRIAVLAIFLATIAVGTGGPSIAAPTLSVLYNFTSANHVGFDPQGTLISNAGALFGTTWEGGRSNLGTVFMLRPPAAGKTAWTAVALREFVGGAGGSRPVGALAAGSGGVLYGATQLGGGSDNDGTIFQLTPPPTGQTQWTFKTIHTFTGGLGGSNPFTGVVRASDGRLFGVTFQGGSTGWGIVFQLTPPAAGRTAWQFKSLYSFRGKPDAGSPQAKLTIGPDGALYETTKLGGSADLGTVFRLAPPASGQGTWTRTTLHHFKGGPTDGAGPLGGVTFDKNGNLYGTTSFGGSHADSGIIFRLAPPTSGQVWTYRVLYNLTRAGGYSPHGDLAIDKDTGALYATTAFGSAHSGVAFKLVPPAAGQTAWVKKNLHQFSGMTTDGGTPLGGLFRASNGRLYGTAASGGKFGGGTIYRIIE